MAIPPSGSTPSQSSAQIKAKAKQALAKGVQDGGPVEDYKPTTDQSGATGNNDYFSALGFDEQG